VVDLPPIESEDGPSSRYEARIADPVAASLRMECCTVALDIEPALVAHQSEVQTDKKVVSVWAERKDSQL
jgi:hypothetical protein